MVELSDIDDHKLFVDQNRHRPPRVHPAGHIPRGSLSHYCRAVVLMKPIQEICRCVDDRKRIDF